MSTPLFAIRPARPADAVALAELRALLFCESGQAHVESEADFRVRCRAAYVESFTSGAAFAWVAQDEAGDIVSAITVLLHPRLPTPALPGTIEGYVAGVYTTPACRRRGLATALLRAATEDARRRGFARLRLHTTVAGRRVYVAHGFIPREDEMELALGPGGTPPTS
ncbi:MAG: GNAT family N-acetyltransferase [Planctomycetota bacterium]|nr:GNAT family N-acetyltransferase [Planctomycetota bacterium]